MVEPPRKRRFEVPPESSTAHLSVCTSRQGRRSHWTQIGGQQWLFDAVYTPVRTPLVKRAMEAGLRVFDGLELFLGQAIDAFQHFTGIDLPDEVAAEVEIEMRALLPIN